MKDGSTGFEESTSEGQREGFDGCGWLAFTLFVWFVATVLGYLLYCPPAPLGSEVASKGEVSARRADEILKVLVGDDIPHPAGSEQNKVVRERIIRLLQSWGYAVTQHKTQNSRNPESDPIPLVNLMVRLPGRTSDAAIMLASHYDSKVGPGASDDGVGTAALLEIARMLKSENETSEPLNDVIFLITDGEEMGLLGAEKFVEEHAWADEVEVVINLEARGTTGPSLMFETSDDSRWLVELFSRVVSNPRASSLFFEIYRFLPNDTDFTMFRQGGMQGYNFAFIGDVKNYHTLQDNYENADRGSLQHHGQNALALIRELKEMDLRSTPKGKAVYFDLFGKCVVWWPEVWSIWMSIIAIALLGFNTVSLARVGALSYFGAASGFFAVGLVGFLTLAIVWLGGICFSLDSRFENAWIDSPVPVELALWFLASTMIVGLLSWVSILRNPECILIGALIFWSAFSIATSLLLSGASYLFLVPLLVACAASLVRYGDQIRVTPLGAFCFAAASAVIWLPNEQLFYDAVGFRMNIAMAVRVALVMTTLLPVLAITGTKARKVFCWSSFVALLVCVLAAIFLNPANP